MWTWVQLSLVGSEFECGFWYSCWVVFYCVLELTDSLMWTWANYWVLVGFPMEAAVAAVSGLQLSCGLQLSWRSRGMWGQEPGPHCVSFGPSTGCGSGLESRWEHQSCPSFWERCRIAWRTHPGCWRRFPPAFWCARRWTETRRWWIGPDSPSSSWSIGCRIGAGLPGRWKTVCCCRSWAAWGSHCQCNWPLAAYCNTWGIESRHVGKVGWLCCYSELVL